MKFTGAKDKNFEVIIREYHKEISDKLLSKFPELESKFDTNSVQILLSNKMTRAIGKANFSKSLIKLSYPLIKKYPQELIPTYGHELCHLVAKVLFGDRGHKRGWKITMAAIGLLPERCHNLDTKEFRRKVQRHIYSCGCADKPEIKTTTIVHKRIQKGRGVYQCRKCQVVISPKRHIRSELI